MTLRSFSCLASSCLACALALTAACGDDDDTLPDAGDMAMDAPADESDMTAASICPLDPVSGDAPLGTWSSVVLADGRVAGIALGDGAGVNDSVVVYDLETGVHSTAYTSSAAFVLGQGVASGDMLYVPEAVEGAPAIVTIDFSGATGPTHTPIGTGPLLPRQIAAVSPGGACSGEGEAVLDPLTSTPAFLVVRGDFTSSAIAALGADLSVINDSWFDSGSTGAGLVAALGGDVSIPSGEVGGVLGIADRFGSNVVTRLCEDGTLLGQARVGEASFEANLHDYVVVGDSLWASRYEFGGTTPMGNDLVELSLSPLELTGERISFDAYNGTAPGFETTTMESVDVELWARPDSIVVRGDHLAVGLDRLPQSLFGTARGAGDGMVAIVDPATQDIVGTHTLEGLANCGNVRAVPGSETDVIVVCRGYSPCGFTDPIGVRATSGFARLSIDSEGAVTEVNVVRLAE